MSGGVASPRPRWGRIVAVVTWLVLLVAGFAWPALMEWPGSLVYWTAVLPIAALLADVPVEG